MPDQAVLCGICDRKADPAFYFTVFPACSMLHRMAIKRREFWKMYGLDKNKLLQVLNKK